MIIIFALLQIAYSLYNLEVKEDGLLIEIAQSLKAYISFQGKFSQISDENDYLYCPYATQGCLIGINNQINQYQLKISEFDIYDQEKHSYNTEIFSFIHFFMEYQDNEDIQNFIALNPFSPIYNSFVYFGYTLCISHDDGYLKTNQNEAIFNHQNKMNGIKSNIKEIDQISDFYSIRIDYLEVEQQIFNISNYSIVLNDQIDYCSIPIELMMKIFKSLSHDFIQGSYIPEYEVYIRETNQQRIENLNLIKFYNVKHQPLVILPEDYLYYNFENRGLDVLKLFGSNFLSEIVLGHSFLKNKIIHYQSETKEIFIEQLQGERCKPNQIKKETIFEYLMFKIIFIIIILIIIYAIFRKIRAQHLLKKNKNVEQQQLISNNEVEVLK